LKKRSINRLFARNQGKPHGIQFGTKYILAGIYSGQFKISDKYRRHLINIWFPEVIEWILEEKEGET
jgi:hypothetical protein